MQLETIEQTALWYSCPVRSSFFFMNRQPRLFYIIAALSAFTAVNAGSSDARVHWHRSQQGSQQATGTQPGSQQAAGAESPGSQPSAGAQPNSQQSAGAPSPGSPLPATRVGKQSKPVKAVKKRATTNGTASDPNTPVVVAPSSLVDLNTARFGKLQIDLSDAAFLDSRVSDLHLLVEKMDMTNGTLQSLSIGATGGEFQGFTIDELSLSTQAPVHFDTNLLLNQKVLQFAEPAHALARVVVKEASLNNFLNSQEVLDRLSGSAKRRIPILSTMAKQDVNFGFNFLKGRLTLEPNNIVRMAMDSKLGIGKGGIPVTISAETKLSLEKGWVILTETRLLTGGQQIPHDMSARIVNRINSLSKWGSHSDDVKFEFTDLKVIPNNRLELQGTAEIRRLRFGRSTENETPSAESAKPAANGSTAPSGNNNKNSADNNAENNNEPKSAP